MIYLIWLLPIALLALHFEACQWHVETVEDCSPRVRNEYSRGLWWRYCKLAARAAPSKFFDA